MKLLIVEDEPLIAGRMERFCRSILGDHLESVRIATGFMQASATLAEQPIDALLLDLNLAGADGMNLLQSAAAGAFHTIIISANVDRAVDAFAHGVLDFVPKPFTQERLAQALQRLTDREARAAYAARYLAVRKHGRIELVPIDSVLYARGAGAYSELVLDSGKVELHDKSLEKLQAVLPPIFERIHKSYLVRMNHVTAFRAQEGSHYEVELKNGERLPVGRTRYKELRDRLG